MLEPDGQSNHGLGILYTRRSLSPGAAQIDLHIPKNRSTGNLLTAYGPNTEKTRMRFSFDAGRPPADFDTMSRSPVMTEHEHGPGPSGLRRIRQQPLRAPSLPVADSRKSSIARSSSMILEMPHTEVGDLTTASVPSSPTLNYTEDLNRFPSESLHSFSFAHQSDEFMHNRQNVLKRSVEFMSQKLGWDPTAIAIAGAQARVSGDQEMQGMLELLARAKLVGDHGIAGLSQATLAGPLTAPAIADDSNNVFDSSFTRPTESPDSSPISMKYVQPTRHRGQIDHLDLNDSRNETATAFTPDYPSSSRTPTNESTTTARTSPPRPRPHSLRRTYTDTARLSLQNKLMDALAQPYTPGDNLQDQLVSPTGASSLGGSFAIATSHPLGPAVHGHSSRWAPTAQAIFTTESTAPYTILAANDLACLVFGVTKAEVRKLGILEVVRKERRAWLEEKLGQPGPAFTAGLGKQTPKPPSENASQRVNQVSSTVSMLGRTGVTASLLSRPNSRQVQSKSRRAQTDDGAGSSLVASRKAGNGVPHHPSNKSRGVLLCGDVVPIQKRNGVTGSASLWVKEKRGGLVWVLEEIHEDFVVLSLDGDAKITRTIGDLVPIWGDDATRVGMDVGKLLPRLPRQGIDGMSDEVDYAELSKLRYFTARNSASVNIPCVVERSPDCGTDLRVSTFPHMAGILVLSSRTLQITSSNSVFSAALFGQEMPDGKNITELIPDFDRILNALVEDDGVQLTDGIVIPEHSFRRARAFLALRDNKSDAASLFWRPDGLPARHRDGSEVKIDVQLRVVKSDKGPPVSNEQVIFEEAGHLPDKPESSTELVFALWITYSREIHAAGSVMDLTSPQLSGIQTPFHQPSPGQKEGACPIEIESDEEHQKEQAHASLLTAQLKEVAKETTAKLTGREPTVSAEAKVDEVPEIVEPEHKKTIDDFVILEEMGQGAYGQVKLARYKKNGNRKMVLKYVTKRRILVDTWTRDRRLGTVPLEIHVLDYLRRDGLKHPNIVEMADFFEDDVNYYIEMVPHGLPGMDLFDYIELRVNMEEAECRSIFVQVAKAVHHLHTRAFVVHRDIKDENVVLDGEGNIKLIDFGSAAYIKNGPFDVFVGTIDYAAPEVLAGKPYRGKEQDVWALGILLYTIVYKENPFYSIDEIMDRDLRVPYVMSDESIELIRAMLDRDVDSRITIEKVLAHPWCSTVKED